MKWSKNGINLLFLTRTDVDKTGKSYYGESNLYLMAAAGNFDCRVTLGMWQLAHGVQSIVYITDMRTCLQTRREASMISLGLPTTASSPSLMDVSGTQHRSCLLC